MPSAPLRGDMPMLSYNRGKARVWNVAGRLGAWAWHLGLGAWGLGLGAWGLGLGAGGWGLGSRLASSGIADMQGDFHAVDWAGLAFIPPAHQVQRQLGL